MTTKKLYVSSAVQKALLTEILIPEMATGFWKDHRPADHAQQWADVQIIITHDEKLGAVDFTVPRLYNFVNPDFIKPNEQRLVDCAAAIKGSSNFRSVKKELIELSRIVGGRLTDKNGVPTKANRGTNKPGDKVQEAVKKTKATAKKATTAVKKTAVKKPAGTTTTKKGNTTVKRTAVVKPEDVEQIADDKENAVTPIELGTAEPQHEEQPSDQELTEAAAMVQGAADLPEGDKIVEKVTTITTTVKTHTELHEVPVEAQAEASAEESTKPTE